MTTAEKMPLESAQYRGSGVADARTAQVASDAAAKQAAAFFGTGTGSLEAARGSSHVSDGVAPLRGEVDIFGRAWDGAAWAAATADETAWVGGTWRGIPLAGDGFDGRIWRSAEWTSGTWNAMSWRGMSWRGMSWRDGAWVAMSWRDAGWSGMSWRDAGWSGMSWRTADLASAGWR
jgi:serine protease AprX